jgi:hypothetical protein
MPRGGAWSREVRGREEGRMEVERGRDGDTEGEREGKENKKVKRDGGMQRLRETREGRSISERNEGGGKRDEESKLKKLRTSKYFVSFALIFIVFAASFR